MHKRWAKFVGQQGSRVAALFASAFLLVFVATPATAQTNATISQGFATKEASIAVGALVSFEPENTNQVELANTEHIDELAGVVVDKPLVELSATDQKVLVATSGPANVIVSDINGAIKAGDKITASPINGVGMKATESTQIVGIAQADFDAGNAETREITDKNGMRHNVKIGSVTMHVNVTYYAVQVQEKSAVPPFLQELANSIAGQNVSLARIVASILILVLAFVSIGSLLYAAIRSSIISIGRNPLSESAVRKSLLQVAAIAIVILLTVLCAIYLILKV